MAKSITKYVRLKKVMLTNMFKIKFNDHLI